jgi:hypothetical protein
MQVAKDYLTKENYPAADCAFCLQTMATVTKSSKDALSVTQNIMKNLNMLESSTHSSSKLSHTSSCTAAEAPDAEQELLKLPCYHVFHRWELLCASFSGIDHLVT